MISRNVIFDLSVISLEIRMQRYIKIAIFS